MVSLGMIDSVRRDEEKYRGIVALCQLPRFFSFSIQKTPRGSLAVKLLPAMLIGRETQGAKCSAAMPLTILGVILLRMWVRWY
jgi:hypothetical protein